MDIKIQKNKITITKNLKRGETYKIQKGRKIESVSFFKKPQYVLGMASKTKDNHDVLFIDYDNVNKDVVLEDFKIIQSKFKLPQAYLFTTKQKKDKFGYTGNYHVVCLLKMLPKKVYTILAYTHCDSAYMDMPLRNKYRNWILRVGAKKFKGRPEFVELIGNVAEETEIMYSLGSISLAHVLFLEKLYPRIIRPDFKNYRLDQLTKIFVQEYEAT